MISNEYFFLKLTILINFYSFFRINTSLLNSRLFWAINGVLYAEIGLPCTDAWLHLTAPLLETRINDGEKDVGLPVDGGCSLSLAAPLFIEIYPLLGEQKYAFFILKNVAFTRVLGVSELILNRAKFWEAFLAMHVNIRENQRGNMN